MQLKLEEILEKLESVKLETTSYQDLVFLGDPGEECSYYIHNFLLPSKANLEIPFLLESLDKTYKDLLHKKEINLGNITYTLVFYEKNFIYNPKPFILIKEDWNSNWITKTPYYITDNLILSMFSEKFSDTLQELVFNYMLWGKSFL
jgi:hypothetical protein